MYPPMQLDVPCFTYCLVECTHVLIVVKMAYKQGNDFYTDVYLF